jgi:hypothetical protein
MASIKINGSTSGYVQLDAPAVAGTTTVTLPSTSGSMLIQDPNGNATIGGGFDSTSVDANGYALRIRASASSAKGILQYTNNPATMEWGNIAMINQDLFIHRTSLGTWDQIPYTNFSFNGGTVAIKEFTGSGVEISDWPVPTLSVITKDDFTGNTVLGFQYRDDGNYTTGQAFWNFRLWDTGSKVVSGSGTSLYLTGPGPMGISAGSNGVMLNLNATSWSAWSDENLKTIIEPITDAVQKVSTLRSVIGHYNTDTPDKRKVFLIAQDVQNVLPEAVSQAQYIQTQDSADVEPIIQDMLLLSYTDMIPLLVAAINELSQKIEDLETRISVLENGGA